MAVLILKKIKTAMHEAIYSAAGQPK